MPKETILVVDDERLVRWSLQQKLEQWGYHVSLAEDGATALARIQLDNPDLITLDVKLPDMTGIEVLSELRNRNIQIPVIVITAFGIVDDAVRSLKLGAYDFIEKPLSLEKVLLCINNAVDHYKLTEEIILLKEKDRGKSRITGESEAIKQLNEQIKIVSPTNAWVLISGENGTGKELVAHTIHRLSRRARMPIIEVNCAAIPEELIESELFGHEKGAFTGATTMKKGKFDLAHEGTLFLDEIGDMSLKAQSKTLRILQEQKFERVGGSRTIHVDVRVVAATNKDLEAEIQKGTFRDDLYFRLNVIPIRVPPLRERVDDIPQLVKEFVGEISLDMNLEPKVFSDDALKVLKRYNWPGNVRELRNLVERLMIMTQDRDIKASDIPSPIQQETSMGEVYTSGLSAASYKEAKGIFEKAYLEMKLREFSWNVSQTAEAIGIERSNLHRKIKAYGLEDPRFQQPE